MWKSPACWTEKSSSRADSPYNALRGLPCGGPSFLPPETAMGFLGLFEKAGSGPELVTTAGINFRLETMCKQARQRKLIKI